MEIAIVILIVAGIFIVRSIKVVPQQNAWVIERLGKYHGSLTPGLNFLVPFVDRVAYKHSLKEIPLDVPSQVCITRDNTQLQVDGILYFQVTDPMRASYGSSNYIVAVTQLAQTSLRSVIGKLELDKTFEERDIINAQVVAAIDEAALNWGVKVLRYEIKDLTPPKEILHAMQSQITAEREKRALIAASEGRRQEQINIATGEREAFIARSEGEKLAAINNAQGEAAAIMAVADANAKAIEMVAAAIRQPGGEQAVQLKVAEQAVDAYSKVAKDAKTTLIVPSNMTEVGDPDQLGHEDGAGQQGITPWNLSRSFHPNPDFSQATPWKPKMSWARTSCPALTTRSPAISATAAATRMPRTWARTWSVCGSRPGSWCFPPLAAMTFPRRGPSIVSRG
jgi:regulator of protease activity HflC (stomatin/prohibitin superfamily)